nr:MAG TPA: hypothetical protein [Caudoviricetes sp.]DAT53820.1 MAG TPA: hypothetical protein [Caudoviricetes sp.]
MNVLLFAASLLIVLLYKEFPAIREVSFLLITK